MKKLFIVVAIIIVIGIAGYVFWPKQERQVPPGKEADVAALQEFLRDMPGSIRECLKKELGTIDPIDIIAMGEAKASNGLLTCAGHFDLDFLAELTKYLKAEPELRDCLTAKMSGLKAGDLVEKGGSMGIDKVEDAKKWVDECRASLNK